MRIENGGDREGSERLDSVNAQWLTAYSLTRSQFGRLISKVYLRALFRQELTIFGVGRIWNHECFPDHRDGGVGSAQGWQRALHLCE